MKSGIHPKYQAVAITCACGNVIETRSTKAGITIEICSNCHPFFTGKQKIVDAAGRVERFTAKYKNVKPVDKKPAAAPVPAARQIIPKVKPVVPIAPPKPSEAGGRGSRPGGGRPGAGGRPGGPGGPGRAGGPRGAQPGGAGPKPAAAAPKPAGAAPRPARSEQGGKPGSGDAKA